LTEGMEDLYETASLDAFDVPLFGWSNLCQSRCAGTIVVPGENGFGREEQIKCPTNLAARVGTFCRSPDQRLFLSAFSRPCRGKCSITVD